MSGIRFLLNIILSTSDVLNSLHFVSEWIFLTDDELFFGAQLASTFSKVKNEQKVEVDYTLRKYITKPKKAPEGYVHYSNFKTLYVEPFQNLMNFEK